MPPASPDPDLLVINTIRTLAMDAVQAANSGHPGTPMALAPVAYCLWQDFLRFDPDDPIWPNRDRFVLSNGHASMLLYSLLHLAGRQGGQHGVRAAGRACRSRWTTSSTSASSTASAPATRSTAGPAGVETTTGPLGQGVATSVGMAIAGRWLAAHYNRPGFELFDYRRLRPLRRRRHDGRDLQRGGLARRASQAVEPLLDLRQQPHHDRGQHRAWRSARTSPPASSATAGTSTRVGDANDLAPCSAAPSRRSRTRRDRPTLIIVRQPHRLRRAAQAGHRRRPRRAAGRGRDPADQSGSTAGPRTPSSSCPTGSASTSPRGSASAGESCATHGPRAWTSTGNEHPELADELERMQHRQLPDGWDQRPAHLPAPTPRAWPVARPRARCSTRSRKNLPWLIGGSGRPGALHQDPAHLRRRRRLRGRQPRRPQPALRHPRARHGRGRSTACRSSKMRRFGSGFLIFSDYARPAIRLSAHHGDPRHLRLHARLHRRRARTAPPTSRSSSSPSLRAIPGLITIRPADANEVVEAWRVIMQLCSTSRRCWCSPGRPCRRSTGASTPRPSGLARGAYVLADADGRPARRDPDRHRQRSVPLRPGVRAARRRGGQAPGW